MAVHGGPKAASTDGLVLSLDGGNLKSFKGQATTNLLTNGDFSSGLTSWINYNGGSGSVVSLFDIPPYLSTSKTALNCITSGTQSVGNYGGISRAIPTLIAGVTYTLSYYARCSTGTLNLRFSNQNGSGDESNLSNTRTITTTWAKYTHTVTLNIVKSNFFIWNQSSPSNTFQITDIQLEASSTASSFVNGTRGTTVATGGGWADLTGNRNHGELVNGVKESSVNGGSLVFDGVDDYVGLGTSTSLIPSYITASMFVYLNSYSSRPHLFGRGEGGIGHFYFVVETSGAFRFYTDIGSGWGFFQPSSFIFPTGVWYNIACTFDGSNVNVYGNGSLLGTGSRVGQLRQYTAQETTLGKILNTQYLNGRIAQVSLYNRALTAIEVQQNYLASKSRFGL